VQEIEDVDNVKVKVRGHEEQLNEVEKGVCVLAEKDQVNKKRNYVDQQAAAGRERVHLGRHLEVVKVFYHNAFDFLIDFWPQFLVVFLLISL